MKKATMDTYWVPGVNHHGCYGRWAFAEFTDVYEIQSDFEARVEEAFNGMIKRYLPKTEVGAAQWLADAGGSAPDVEDIPRRRSEIDG